MIFITVKSNLESTDSGESFKVKTSINSNIDTGLKLGKLPPDFKLTTITGETLTLSDHKGKKVILNFWTSWCPPCKEEMPHMEKYYQKNKDSQNVEIIAINMTNSDNIKSVEKFVDAYELTFPIPLDKSGNVMDAYEIKFLPETYLINSEGIIAHHIRGPVNEKVLTDLVSDLP
ncbi:peroxiredoxin family protein [Paenisporosarcina sp. NPDC076898]